MKTNKKTMKLRDEFIRLINALKYSINGITAASNYEKAFRDEFIMLLIIIVVVVFIPISNLERVLIVGCWLLVMVVELINSAIEMLANKITQEFDQDIKRLKDYASAAVLILITNWILVCLAIINTYL